MSAPTKIEILPSLGGTMHVCFKRTDIKGVTALYHTIAQAPPGAPFSPWEHFPCDVCAVHHVTAASLGRALDTLLTNLVTKGGAPS